MKGFDENWPKDGPFRDFMREHFPNDDFEMFDDADPVLRLLVPHWGSANIVERNFIFQYDDDRCTDITGTQYAGDQAIDQDIHVEVVTFMKDLKIAYLDYNDYGGGGSVYFSNNIPKAIELLTDIRDDATKYLQYLAEMKDRRDKNDILERQIQKDEDEHK